MAAVRTRDRQERARFNRDLAEFERIEEERRLAPVRDAEAELRKTHSQLLKREREEVLNGTDEMAASLLSDEMRAITPERSITMEQAAAFNEREAIRFAETTPEFYPCPENAELITGYCTRNQIQVCDAQSYKNIFNRLNDLGLMEQRRIPEPEPETVEQPKQTPIQPQEFEGVDESGRPKVYTRAEIDRMSADEYRRYMRIPTKAYAEYEEVGMRW